MVASAEPNRVKTITVNEVIRLVLACCDSLLRLNTRTPGVGNVLDRSRPLPKVGLAFALIAAVGYVALGWRFGGDSGPIPTAIAAVAVVVAVGATLREKL